MVDFKEQPRLDSLCVNFFFFNRGVYLFKHLHTKGRKDDLFTDPCYQQFGEELNKVLKDWQPSVLPDGQYRLILTFNCTVDSIFMSTGLKCSGFSAQHFNVKMCFLPNS